MTDDATPEEVRELSREVARSWKVIHEHRNCCMANAYATGLNVKRALYACMGITQKALVGVCTIENRMEGPGREEAPLLLSQVCDILEQVTRELRALGKRTGEVLVQQEAAKAMGS